MADVLHTPLLLCNMTKQGRQVRKSSAVSTENAKVAPSATALTVATAAAYLPLGHRCN